MPDPKILLTQTTLQINTSKQKTAGEIDAAVKALQEAEDEGKETAPSNVTGQSAPRQTGTSASNATRK